MLEQVDFCGLKIARLIIGANPFGGYSHFSAERDKVMREYYTVDNIKAAWAKAEAAGMNTMITNNETPHVMQAVTEYLASGGKLQWIAQVNINTEPDMMVALDEAVEAGCCALYIHGGVVDNLYKERDEASLRKWSEFVRSKNIPFGVAGHDPLAHLWVNSLDVVDFHAVCCFNCGTIHEGKGETFIISDLIEAMKVINFIEKPCIAYKIMGAGRINPEMAFEHAFKNIKPTDVVNVGMYLGDNENMIEENVTLAEEYGKKL
jgi:hypothetical protein